MKPAFPTFISPSVAFVPHSALDSVPVAPWSPLIRSSSVPVCRSSQIMTRAGDWVLGFGRSLHLDSRLRIYFHGCTAQERAPTVSAERLNFTMRTWQSLVLKPLCVFAIGVGPRQLFTALKHVWAIIVQMSAPPTAPAPLSTYSTKPPKHRLKI